MDALDIERLQPYLNPLKMPLPYPGATLLEGTVTIQTGLSGKLFAASQKVYLRLAMSQSSLTAFSNLPMLSWVPYSESRCQSCAEVEQDGLPEDLFETACTSIILVPGFTIGATKNVRPGFKRCTRIDWPTSGDFVFVFVWAFGHFRYKTIALQTCNYLANMRHFIMSARFSFLSFCHFN